MIRTITVRDVYERHDCAGYKSIEVTAMEEDELIPSRFRLTKAYMFPHEKLLLGCVAPMDEVMIVIDDHNSSPLIMGEYIRNISNMSQRDPLCRCGTILVSDGFDIVCPNEDCGLTLLTRLERLANTRFFSHEELLRGNTHRESFVITGDPTTEKPFLPILQPSLWGESTKDLETILLQKRRPVVSVATFLVGSLLREFIDYVNPLVTEYHPVFNGITTFYGYMDEVMMRRDYESSVQNTLLKEFIWALGIESLKEDVIDRMVSYEVTSGWMEDVMIPYAYLLSHPKEMIAELGIDYLEACAISTEFLKRKYEFQDIFTHYSSPEAMYDVFKDVR